MDPWIYRFAVVFRGGKKEREKHNNEPAADQANAER